MFIDCLTIGTWFLNNKNFKLFLTNTNVTSRSLNTSWSIFIDQLVNTFVKWYRKSSIKKLLFLKGTLSTSYIIFSYPKLLSISVLIFIKWRFNTELLTNTLRNVVFSAKKADHRYRKLINYALTWARLFNIFINDFFYFIEHGTLYNYADDNTLSYADQD